jgi:hypothetical protein
MWGAISQFPKHLHDVVLIKHRDNFWLLTYAYMEEGYDYLIPIEIRTRYFLLRYLRFNICLKKETREKDAKFVGN